MLTGPISSGRVLAALMVLAAPAVAMGQPVEPEESPAAPAQAAPTPSRARAEAQDQDAMIAEIAARMELDPSGLTADEAARQAVATAPGVRRAHATHQQAMQAAAQARSSFIPILTLTAGYTRLSEIELPPFVIPGLPATDNPFPQVLDMFLFRATVAIPVSDYFLTILPAYEGAEGFAEAAAQQTVLAELQTAFRAREAFYHYMRALGGLAIATQAVSTLEDALEAVESLTRAGVLPRADGLQMRARVASARAGAARARGAVRLTARLVRTMMHASADEPLQLGENLLEIPSPAFTSEPALVAEALEHRPEARALRALLGARESMVRVREGALLPRVIISGQADLSNPNQRFIPQSEVFNGTWALGVALTWSPTSVPGQLNGLEQAHSQIAQAREDLLALEDGISIEATQVLTEYETARESIESTREALFAARAAFADRRRLLTAGVGTTTELAAAQLELTHAQLAFVDSMILLHVAAASIERVAGRVGLSRRNL